MEENQNEREFFTLVDDDGQELEFDVSCDECGGCSGCDEEE